MMCLNWFSPQNLNQEKKMENQEVLKAVERDNVRLQKELKDHKNGCGCENSSEKKDMSLSVGGNEAEAECEACGA